MLSYRLLDAKGHFFCTQPSRRQPQPQRRSLSPEPPCTGAARGHIWLQTPLHLLKALPNTPRELWRTKPASRWGEGTQPFQEQQHSPVSLCENACFFSASLQAWLSQKFKVCGDRSSLQQCCVCLRCCALGGPTELFSF